MFSHGLAFIIMNGMICKRTRELAFGVLPASSLHWISGIMRSFFRATFLPVSMFWTTHFSTDSSMTIPREMFRLVCTCSLSSSKSSLRTRIDCAAFSLFGEFFEGFSSIRTIWPILKRYKRKDFSRHSASDSLSLSQNPKITIIN